MTEQELTVYYDRAVKAGKAGLAGRIGQQIRFRQGFDDRGRGVGARSANGAYLNGYYAKSSGLYYLTRGELRALD
jgi:hypothetical protein